jgi:hypothetical protein
MFRQCSDVPSCQQEDIRFLHGALSCSSLARPVLMETVTIGEVGESSGKDQTARSSDIAAPTYLPVKKCDGCTTADATADCLACSNLENTVSFCNPCWNLSHRFGLT